MKTTEKVSVLRDPLEGLLTYELRKTSAAVMGAIAFELESLDLRWSDASLMMVIGANPGCTQSDISRALRIQPTNVVPLINKLTRAGLLERVAGEGRAVSLFLTKSGAALLKQVKSAIARQEARLSRNLSQAQKAQVTDVLHLLCKNACCD